jgi:hypothetical protein
MRSVKISIVDVISISRSKSVSIEMSTLVDRSFAGECPCNTIHLACMNDLDYIARQQVSPRVTWIMTWKSLGVHRCSVDAKPPVIAGYGNDPQT